MDDIEQLEEEMRESWKRVKCKYCKKEFRKTYTNEKYCSVECYKEASQVKANNLYLEKKNAVLRKRAIEAQKNRDEIMGLPN